MINSTDGHLGGLIWNVLLIQRLNMFWLNRMKVYVTTTQKDGLYGIEPIHKAIIGLQWNEMLRITSIDVINVKSMHLSLNCHPTALTQ